MFLSRQSSYHLSTLSITKEPVFTKEELIEFRTLLSIGWTSTMIYEFRGENAMRDSRDWSVEKVRQRIKVCAYRGDGRPNITFPS